MADSPGSPLSSLASDDLIEGLKMEEREASVDAVPDNGSDQVMMPPSKRQKTKAGGGGRGARAPSWDMRTSSPVNGTQEDDTDISSDSSGDIPASPATLALLPEEDPAYPQVTACKWDGCPAGDLGNMDALVLHIHDDHIGSRQKKYACEWERCPRKGMPHASGYALKAHMRSHTREKPFYCALPECDRSFTRSDALAKHMRTVHETEALRPSDPVPKSHPAQASHFPRLKLILSAKPPEERGNRKQRHDDDDDDDDDDDSSANDEEDEHHHTHNHHDTVLPTTATPELDALAAAAAKLQEEQQRQQRQRVVLEPYPADLGFSMEEMGTHPQQLFRLLRRQVHWAEEESRDLGAEIETLERRRKQEWILKELLLENVMETELMQHRGPAPSSSSPTKANSSSIGRFSGRSGNGHGHGEGSMSMMDSERKPTLLPKSLPRTFANGDEWFPPVQEVGAEPENDEVEDAGLGGGNFLNAGQVTD